MRSFWRTVDYAAGRGGFESLTCKLLHDFLPGLPQLSIRDLHAKLDQVGTIEHRPST